MIDSLLTPIKKEKQIQMGLVYPNESVPGELRAVDNYSFNILLDQRIEDREFFQFIENEIRLNIWDYDDDFLRFMVGTLALRGPTGEQLYVSIDIGKEYKGYAPLPQTQAVPTYAMGYQLESRSKEATIHFSTNIKEFDEPITAKGEIGTTEYITVGGGFGGGAIPIPGLPRYYLTVPSRDPEALLFTGFSRNPITQVLDYLFRDKIDYSAMRWFNNYEHCYYYVYVHYFVDEQRTSLQFLRDIAETFNAKIIYDGEIIYLIPRAAGLKPNSRGYGNISQGDLVELDQSNIKHLNDYPLDEIQPEIKAAQHQGLHLTYTPPNNEPNAEPPQYLEYDADMNWKNWIVLRPEEIENVDPKKVTLHAGAKQGAIFDLDLELLSYLYTNRVIPDDLIVKGIYTFDANLENWVLSSGDETAVFEHETNHARLAVTTAGTQTLYPRIYNNESFDGSVSAGVTYKVLFDYTVNSGTCRLRNIQFGDTFIAPDTILSGSGEFEADIFLQDKAEKLWLYFDGTNTFDLDLDNIRVKRVGDRPPDEFWAGESSPNYLRLRTLLDTFNQLLAGIKPVVQYKLIGEHLPNLGALYTLEEVYDSEQAVGQITEIAYDSGQETVRSTWELIARHYGNATFTFWYATSNGFTFGAGLENADLVWGNEE